MQVHTQQSLFDTICIHLCTQGKPAYHMVNGVPNGCAYRGTDGTSCAVGCLIPDELYTESIEGAGIHAVCFHSVNDANSIDYNIDVATLRKITDKLGLTEHSKFLASMQTAHDDWDVKEPDEFLASLKRVACVFELDSSVLDRFSV